MRKYTFILLSIGFILIINTFDPGETGSVLAQNNNGNVSETKLSGLVYVNDLHLLKKEMFYRIRDCSELKYILTQVILYPGIFNQSLLERDRIVELAHAGKRVVIQIWFGPGLYYNWSYCSYPNIVMRQSVRDYLFPVIDSVITQIGPEHIYAIHLLEEDGHFGVDIDEPGDWRLNKGAVRSGKEDNNPYTNFVSLRKLYGGHSDWCYRVPNVAQYNSVFKAETGLDMDSLPNDPLAYPVLDRWMARRLWAGAHRVFLQHIKKKYPTIKCFIWAGLAYPWNGNAMDALRDIVDGYVADPYTDTLPTHHSLSGARVLLPEAESLILLYDSHNPAEKYLRAATAYVNGATAIGFFETGSRAILDQELWDSSVDIWKKISVLPVVRSAKPKVLIVSGNTDNGYSTSKRMLPFFRFPAALPERDAAGVNLSDYKIIVLHNCVSFRNDLALSRYNMTGYGPDDRELKNWVASGGLLVLTSPDFSIDSQFFVAEEHIVWTSNKWTPARDQPVTFTCKPHIASKYGIKSRYTLLAGVRQFSWGRGVSYDIFPIGGVTKYGKGRIVFLPIFHRDPVLINESTTDEYRNRWQIEMANYIADVVRGVAMVHDSSGLLAREITLPGESFGLTYEDESQSVKTVFDKFDQAFTSSIRLSGKLILGDLIGTK